MSRVGTKRSDRRWEDPDGTVWASRFEYEVFCILRDATTEAGSLVRKCEQGGVNTFHYHTPVRQARCVQCGSGQVVQERTYTPDVCVTTRSKSGLPSTCYVEIKGYFPAEKRGLLRHFRQTGPDIDLVVVAQANHWVTKGRTRLSDYFARYLKDVPFYYLTGKGKTEDIADAIFRYERAA